MKRLLLSFIFIIAITLNAFAYETNVHEKITKNAIAISNIRQYLSNNLNVSLDGLLNGETGTKWLEQGSNWEDNAPRWLNHFYDPTTGQGLGIGVPSLEWGNSYYSNSYNWSSARQYFYNALTGISLGTRETNFTDLFRSLGQIVHLIQDKAVPAHVKNDTHFPYFDTVLHDKDMYEEYTRISEGSLTYNGYPSVYSPADNITFNAFDTFWKNSGKGLAEFTNSNFFSRDTNVDNPEHQPQYLNPTVLLGNQEFQEEITNADGDKEIVTVRYGLGTVTDSYANTLHTDIKLTAYSLWDFDYNQKMGNEVYSLNDTIHQTYADFLLPRSVGYSAGLLNYFFRGDIDIIPDEETGSGYVIVNNTDEDMDGTFELWYDNKNNERLKVSDASWTLSINKKSSNANKSTNITFTPPTDMKEENKYLLVFQGKLGNEQGAVTGRMVELKEFETYILLVNANLTRLPSHYNILPLKIKIVDRQYQLISKYGEDLNISIYGADPTSYNFIIQSTPDNTEHYLSYPGTYWSSGQYIGVHYIDEIKEYGVEQTSGSRDHYGTKASFIPRSVNGPYFTDYFSGKLRQKDGDYYLFALGRHNFTLRNTGELLSYREGIWWSTTASDVCAYNYVYRYFSPQLNTYINGEIVATDHYGEGFAVGGVECSGARISNKIIAAMGNGKAIVLKIEYKPEKPTSIVESTLWESPNVEGCKVKVQKYLTSYSNSQRMALNLEVGGQIVDSYSNDYEHYYESIDILSENCVNSGEVMKVLEGYPGGTYPLHYLYQIRGGGSEFPVRDYDSINGDKTSIVIYSKIQSDTVSENNYTFKISPGYTKTEVIMENSTATAKYTNDLYMFHQIPSMGAQKTLLYSDSKSTYVDTGVTEGVSTQISKDIMVYTYIIKKWDGAEYVFDKRIVGLINISDDRLPVGYRQEFTMNSENYSTADFDYTKEGAIGIHKIKLKK